jgi:M6 family metalloprotease-like protein
MIKKSTFGIGVALFLAAATLWGAYLRNFPISVNQPDGSKLDLFVTGDEYYHWMHDSRDYTIVLDPTSGCFVYAVKGADGELVPSPYIAGRSDPAALGLARSLRRPAVKVQKGTNDFIRNAVQPYVKPAPKTGSLNNLVVFIRFAAESEFTDPISYYSSVFNQATVGANSMHNYFLEASYNALDVSTTFYPAPGTTVVSYQDAYARGYYQPYNAATNLVGYTGGDNGAARRDREHILLMNAVHAISSQVPAGLNIDGDNDGTVDNVCFIIDGSPTGWASLLWPHQWALYSQTAYINGKLVYTYNFQLQNSLLSSGVGVLCHEMCHSLGAPDLYHYSSDGLHPVYTWDIMEYDLNPPQHMGAYMKNKYMSWIASVPEITTSGTYTLNPITSPTGNVFKIRSPNSTTEYFVVEYRRQSGTFESSIPDSGLLVYRINSTCTGNSDGPPDEVYIYRPYGTTADDGLPAYANFSSDVGQTSINDTTDPSSFLSNGSAGGLNISSVGSAGSTISFNVTLGSSPPGLTLASPDGGEAWIVNSMERIAWTSSGVSGNVNIYLYKGTSNLGLIATGVPVGSGGYDWKAGFLKNGTKVVPGNTYRVSIVSVLNRLNKDMSDGYFSLVKPKITVKAPLSGTSWRLNSVQRITWTFSAVSGTADIYLYRNGLPKGLVGAAIPIGDLGFSWTVGALTGGPSVPTGTGYQIRVTTSDGLVTGRSGGTFTIRR